MPLQANGQASRNSLGGRASRLEKGADICTGARRTTHKSQASAPHVTSLPESAACISKQPFLSRRTNFTKSHSSRTLGSPGHLKEKCSSVSSSTKKKTNLANQRSHKPEVAFQQKSASYTPPPIHVSHSQGKSASYISEPISSYDNNCALTAPDIPSQTNSASYTAELISSFEEHCSLSARTLPSHKCYICGAKHLTLQSLEIHKKACRRCFEQREAKRPSTQRRKLLAEDELPEGFECLEAYYDSASIGVRRAKRNPIEEWLASWSCGLVDLGENSIASCPELQEHLVPSSEEGEAPVPDEEARGAPMACPKRCASSPSVHQRQKCPTCARSFRSEVFNRHIQFCGAPRQPPRKPRQPLKQPCATTLSRQKTLPSGHFHSSAAGGHRGKREVSIQSEQNQVPWSSAVLMSKGCIQPASFEDKARLRMELLASIPEAKFVGAYKVLSGQRGIYEAVREDMQQGEAQPVEERELWHGTSWAIVPKIMEQGFNRIFAGKHGTLLGIATYFSTDLGYSQRFCDRRGGGTDGTKVAILARVVVGRYCKGCATDVEPPLVDSVSGVRYNSTVDNLQCPKIFAVFRDFQAVPLFLIEFRS